jgi:hypothetical protein
MFYCSLALTQYYKPNVTPLERKLLLLVEPPPDITCLAYGEVETRPNAKASAPSFPKPVISRIAARVLSQWPEAGLEEVRDAIDETSATEAPTQKDRSASPRGLAIATGFSGNKV